MGNAFTEYLVPCRQCRLESIPSPTLFTLQDLVRESETTDTVFCEQHCTGGGVVRIADIAPDVMLQDFGELLLHEGDIEYNERVCLGVGGQGSVYTGTFGDAKVAVKLFPPCSYDEGAWIEPDRQPHYMLRQECCILRLLDHPAIVKFYGVVLRPRSMVMELAHYGSFDGMLKTRDPISRLFAHRVLIQVSEGLDYLHRMAIIYRDLKPNNILIVSKDLGVEVNAKLTDFGISGLSTDEGLLCEVGTKGYMATNINGQQAYDQDVDVFSYGILVREVLTGERVCGNLMFGVQIAEAFNNGAAHLTSNRHNWHDLTHILNLCVSSRPTDRPTAKEITSWLARIDVLALRTVEQMLDPGLEATDKFTTIPRGEGEELWLVVKRSGAFEKKYGVAVLALDRTNSLVQLCMLEVREDANCICGYHGDLVVVGGSRGTLTLLNATTYTVINVVLVPGLTPEDKILSMTACPGFLVLGLRTGRIAMLSRVGEGSTKAGKMLTVCGSPITEIATWKSNILVASDQSIHVYEVGGFTKLCTVELSGRNMCPNSIIKMVIVGKEIWLTMFNSSLVYVCPFKTNPSDHIISVSLDSRKNLDIREMLSGKRREQNVGSDYNMYCGGVFEGTDHRIKCLRQCGEDVFVGLSNGTLIQLDNTTYRIKFLARRHRDALRVVCQLGEDVVVSMATGAGVVDLTGARVPGTDTCTWDVSEDQAQLADRYLQARKRLIARYVTSRNRRTY